MTAAILDTEASLRDAKATAQQLETARLSSSVTVDDVAWSANHVTVSATNTGSIALDSTHVDVLLDGVLFTGQDRDVVGYSGSLWPPGAQLTMDFLAPDLGGTYATVGPDSASLVTDTGSMATWSA